MKSCGLVPTEVRILFPACMKMSQLTQATLCVILNEKTREILLGMKRKGLFGGGNYNGPGGKFMEIDKTLEQTAIRETQEESGLVVRLEDLTKAGEFTFICKSVSIFYRFGETEKLSNFSVSFQKAKSNLIRLFMFIMSQNGKEKLIILMKCSGNGFLSKIFLTIKCGMMINIGFQKF